jgi:hypothetical protein
LFNAVIGFWTKSLYDAYIMKREAEDVKYFPAFKTILVNKYKNYFSYKQESGELKSDYELKLIRRHRKDAKRLAAELILGWTLFT